MDFHSMQLRDGTPFLNRIEWKSVNNIFVFYLWVNMDLIHTANTVAPNYMYVTMVALLVSSTTAMLPTVGNLLYIG